MYIFLYIWKFHTCIQRNIIFTLLLLPSPTTTMFFKNCPSEFHDPLNNPLNLFSTFHTWVAIHWSMRNLQVATISKLIMSVPSLNNYSPSTASHQVVRLDIICIYTGCIPVLGYFLDWSYVDLYHIIMTIVLCV